MNAKVSPFQLGMVADTGTQCSLSSTTTVYPTFRLQRTNQAPLWKQHPGKTSHSVFQVIWKISNLLT